jgi:hypothetical protein
LHLQIEAFEGAVFLDALALQAHRIEEAVGGAFIELIHFFESLEGDG